MQDAEKIQVKFQCTNAGCSRRSDTYEWEGEIYKYQLGLVAIWFHGHHEGHKFNYWENGELLLGPG